MLFTVFTAVPATAQEFYLDIGNDSAQINYSPRSAYETSLPWGVSLFWNNDNDKLAKAYIATPLEGNGFTAWLFSASLGLFYLDLNQADAGTTGILAGFHAGYRFLTSTPLSIIFTAEVSPDLLNTGDDITTMNQFTGRLQADLSPYVHAHLGYRFYSVTFDDEVRFKNKDSLDFEEGVFLGFTLTF